MEKDPLKIVAILVALAFGLFTTLAACGAASHASAPAVSLQPGQGSSQTD